MKNNNLNLVLLITSSVILVTVYYLEYFLNLKPCILCIYQRVPYFFAIVLGILFLLTKNYNTRKILYYLYFITFLTGLLLATYHFGIEKNLWIAFTGCEINSSLENNYNLKEYLLKKEFTECSETNFTLFGLSLAGYNIIISLFLLIFSFLKIRKI